MKTRCYIKSRGKSKSSEYSSLGLGPDLLDLHEKLEEAEVKRSTQLHSDKSFMQRTLPLLFQGCGISKSWRPGSTPFLFQTVAEAASPYQVPLANSSLLYFPPGGRISTLKRLRVLPYELGCWEIYTH